jgi:NAD(P)-dependent dehydrogenase (short-subunit alcohol dehydrogenase family)
MGRLDGKVALISGGARGQGAVEVQLFAREGAKVVFGDVLDAEGRNVEAAIRQAGHEATYIHLDVTQEADWQRAVQTAVSTYGTLDILVNNAGILRRENIEETSRELWDTVLAVNATGVFLGTKYAIPAMRAAGGGSIVNISSVSGMVALGAPAYNASKGAVRVFTKVTAIHHAKDNIRCNSIHPGPIDTPMTQTTDAERRAKIVEDVPLGRYGTSEDIAYGVLYLASDEAAYMTGAELVIDGGYTAQ